jgi:hypothetical protein
MECVEYAYTSSMFQAECADLCALFFHKAGEPPKISTQAALRTVRDLWAKKSLMGVRFNADDLRCLDIVTKEVERRCALESCTDFPKHPSFRGTHCTFVEQAVPESMREYAKAVAPDGKPRWFRVCGTKNPWEPGSVAVAIENPNKFAEDVVELAYWAAMWDLKHGRLELTTRPELLFLYVWPSSAGSEE